jgi:hypothetical protein
MKKILFGILLVTMCLHVLGCEDEYEELRCEADMMCQPACDYDPDCADSVNQPPVNGGDARVLIDPITDSGKSSQIPDSTDASEDSGVDRDSGEPELQKKMVTGLLSGGTCNSACERESYQCDVQCGEEYDPNAGTALYQDSNQFIKDIPIETCETEIESDFIDWGKRYTLYEYRCCCLAPPEIPIDRIKGDIFNLKSCDDVCMDHDMVCVPDASWSLLAYDAGAYIVYTDGTLTAPRPGNCSSVPDIEYVHDTGRYLVLSEYECACQEES